MITEKDVQQVAKLARIHLKPTEQENFKKELSSILEYIEKLNRADTNDVEPLYQTTGLQNAFRSDEKGSDPKFKRGLLKSLLEQAPEREKDLIKVKSVFKKGQQ